MAELEGSIQLTWNQFQTNNASHFKQVQASKDFTDVTLVTEDGSTTESHRIILAAGSQFFQRTFEGLNEPLMRTHPHPLIFLKGVKSDQLDHLLDFLYCGATSVPQDSVQTFLELASHLGVKGLISETSSSVLQEERADGSLEMEQEANLTEETEREFIKKEFHPSRDPGGQLKDLISVQGEDLVCNICELVSTDKKSMKKHIKVHLQNDRKKTTGLGKQRSKVWESFTRTENGLEASCNVCGKVFQCPTGSTSNLANHIEKKHNEDKIRTSKKRSKVWESFTRAETGVSASCDLCGKTFNCVSGTTSNLANHLRKKHDMLF